MSPDQPILSGEFTRAISSLREEMRIGLDAIVNRLDRINGRLDRHDEQLAEWEPRFARNDERIQTIMMENSARQHDSIIIPITPRVVLALIVSAVMLFGMMLSFTRGWTFGGRW